MVVIKISIVADKAYHRIMVIFPAVETFVQSLLNIVPHSALAGVLNPVDMCIKETIRRLYTPQPIIDNNTTRTVAHNCPVRTLMRQL